VALSGHPWHSSPTHLRWIHAWLEQVDAARSGQRDAHRGGRVRDDEEFRTGRVGLLELSDALVAGNGRRRAVELKDLELLRERERRVVQAASRAPCKLAQLDQTALHFVKSCEDDRSEVGLALPQRLIII
jgi:hypothetical protein